MVQYQRIFIMIGEKMMFVNQMQMLMTEKQKNILLHI